MIRLFENHRIRKAKELDGMWDFKKENSDKQYKLPVPGLHLDKEGMWCDKWDYIVLGSSVANKVERKVIATPFGKYGRVYDTGGYSTPSWLCDVATSW